MKLNNVLLLKTFIRTARFLIRPSVPVFCHILSSVPGIPLKLMILSLIPDSAFLAQQEPSDNRGQRQTRRV